MAEYPPIDPRVAHFTPDLKAAMTDVYEGHFGGGAMPLYETIIELSGDVERLEEQVVGLELQLEGECEEHGQTVHEWETTLREIVEKEHHGHHEVAWMWCTHAACVLIRDHT